MSVNIRAVLGKVPRIAATLSELRYLVFEGQKGDKGDTGADGVSPTVQVTNIPGGNRVTITDKNGPKEFEVDDGISPSVLVADIEGGHRVTITGAEGSRTFNVMDGAPGADYVLTPQDKQEIADQAAALVDVPTKTSELQNDSGFVTTQQAAAAAPVQSVNGKTGAVAVREVPDYSNAIDGQVLTKTQDGPRWANNNPSSGAALRLLYDGAFGPDDPDLMLMGNVADAETGNAIATALYYGRIGSAVLVDVTDPNTEVVYDLLAVDYDAQTHVSTVTFARTEAGCIRTAALSGSTKAAPVFDTIPLAGGGSAENAVLYTAQSLTDSQKAQARTNVGAGTYSKPSGGIPASDLAPGVIPDISGKANAADVYTKTEVDQKLVGAMDYKGTKATVSALPTSGNETGDVWHITADGSEWAWNGSAWEELGTAVDLSGYRTASAQDAIDSAQDTAIAAKYTKPSTGIPKTDLASDVKASLGKADTALQEHQSLAPYRTASAQDEIDNAQNVEIRKKANSADLAAVATSGSYNDLADKPSIPSLAGYATEAWVNNKGYLTLADLPVYNGGVT